MDRMRFARPALVALLLAACGATGETQRPVHVVEAVDRVVEALASETVQRLASEAFRGLPVVVRSAGVGADAVVSELLRTRLVERAVPVEAACPAKCMEIGLLEFTADAGGARALRPGEIVAAAGGKAPLLPGLPRAASDPGPLGAGRASALLVTFSAREGNRYGPRQQLIAVLATASVEPPK
jgi:hypothetical protein